MVGAGVVGATVVVVGAGVVGVVGVVGAGVRSEEHTSELQSH